jgi:hypothetical protein
MVEQSRAQKLPSASDRHLSIPTCVHSVSIEHGVQSSDDSGTHSLSNSPSWPTEKQPQPVGQTPHSSVQTPPVGTTRHRSDWHCELPVHGTPKPSFSASGAASIDVESCVPESSHGHATCVGSQASRDDDAQATNDNKSAPPTTKRSISRTLSCRRRLPRQRSTRAGRARIGSATSRSNRNWRRRQPKPR